MTIPTLDDIKKEFQTPKPAHKNHFTSLEKVGVFVTQRVGTMGFFMIILSWTILWLGWNTLGPKELRFDPAPAFVLWLFISNLIQLHLLPLLMVGQNIQSTHAELREQHDYETDRKAEKEIETILLHLEHQQKLTLQILERLEKLENKR